MQIEVTRRQTIEHTRVFAVDPAHITAWWAEREGLSPDAAADAIDLADEDMLALYVECHSLAFDVPEATPTSWWETVAEAVDEDDEHDDPLPGPGSPAPAAG